MGVCLFAAEYRDATYLFAVGMRDSHTRASFTLAGQPGKAIAEALGENRMIEVHNGVFADDFQPYAVHLYRIRDDGRR